MVLIFELLVEQMTLLEAEKSTAALPEAGASSLLLPKTGTSSSLDACAALHAFAAGICSTPIYAHRKPLFAKGWCNRANRTSKRGARG